MKLRLIAALTSAATLLLSGVATAAAYPVKERQLTDNVLYKTGRLPKSTCAEPNVKPNDRAQGRRYITSVVRCLEYTWEQHLSDNGLKFEAPRLKFVTGSYCGIGRKDDSGAVYCDDQRTIAFKLGKTWLEEPSDLWMMYNVAAVYAYHVQNQVGIILWDNDDFYDSKSARAEYLRRLSLQSDCLTGAFIKSIWPMDGRSTRDWSELQELLGGDEPGEERLFGKRANARMWLKRGFTGSDLASCNTWTAPSSEVA